MIVSLSTEQILVNPGGVGLQAYTDNLPYHHKMETGSSHARYSLLSRVNNHLTIEQCVLTYAWDKVASVTLENGRPDLVKGLKRGEHNYQSVHLLMENNEKIDFLSIFLQACLNNIA